MSLSLLIIETDKVPVEIKKSLKPFKIEYGNMLESSKCEFVTEYRDSTENFVDFVTSFFENNKNLRYDVFQMQLTIKSSDEKSRLINLQGVVNRLMSSMIVRKSIYYSLGDREVSCFTSDLVYYASEQQIKYLIKELELSELRKDRRYGYIYGIKLYMLSRFCKDSNSRKYVENLSLNDIEKIILQREEYLADIKVIEKKKNQRCDNSWRSIFRLIAVKLGIIKHYRGLGNK